MSKAEMTEEPVMNAVLDTLSERQASEQLAFILVMICRGARPGGQRRPCGVCWCLAVTVSALRAEGEDEVRRHLVGHPEL